MHSDALSTLWTFFLFISINGVMKAVKMQHKDLFCLLHVRFIIVHVHTLAAIPLRDNNRSVVLTGLQTQKSRQHSHSGNAMQDC